MANEYGGNSADSPTPLSESSPKTFDGEWSNNARTLIGFSEVTIDDMIQMHLVDCAQCRDAPFKRGPVAIGQKSGLCDAYWELQLARANYEGRVNNVVAHTEYGDEAPKLGRLELWSLRAKSQALSSVLRIVRITIITSLTVSLPTDANMSITASDTGR